MCILCQSKFLILVKSPGICLKVLESPGIWIMFFCGKPALYFYPPSKPLSSPVAPINFIPNYCCICFGTNKWFFWRGWVGRTILALFVFLPKIDNDSLGYGNAIGMTTKGDFRVICLYPIFTYFIPIYAHLRPYQWRERSRLN